MKTKSVIVFLSMLLFSCQQTNSPSQNDGDKSSVPPTWKTVKFYNFFSFRIPPNLDSQKVVGFDSNVGRYRDTSMDLNIDYGTHCNTYQGYASFPMYTETTLQISSQLAKEVFFYSPHYDSLLPFIAGVYFARVDSNTQNELTVEVHCKKEMLQDTARVIFSTIQLR